MPYQETGISVSHHKTKHPRPDKPSSVSKFYKDSAELTSTGETPFHEQNGNEVYEGVIFQTSIGPWLVLPPQSGVRLDLQTEPYVLNGAGKELKSRERPSKVSGDAEKEHERHVQFFTANWKKLVPIFYHQPVTSTPDLNLFAEVELNDFVVHYENDYQKDENGLPIRRTAGRADFIGEGPDGQLIIVEFGKSLSGKTVQVARHSASVEALVKMKNIEEGEPMVSAFLGQYDTYDGMRRLTLTDPPIPDYLANQATVIQTVK